MNISEQNLTLLGPSCLGREPWRAQTPWKMSHVSVRVCVASTPPDLVLGPKKGRQGAMVPVMLETKLRVFWNPLSVYFSNHVVP